MNIYSFMSRVSLGAAISLAASVSHGQSFTALTPRADYNCNHLMNDRLNLEKSQDEVARMIRRQLSSNDQLSVYAQNIRIEPSNGKFTLKGVVDSESERRAVLYNAEAIAGRTNIIDRMELGTE